MFDLVYIAKLGKTVGLKGQLKIYIESDFPTQFKVGNTFTTNKNKTLQIESYNPKNDTIKFVGIDDIDEAKKLVTQQLFTTIDQTREDCELEENQYFWFDMIGCEINEDNKILGTVVEIHRYPIEDYLEVKTSQEILQNHKVKTFLVPYNDTFVKNVDIDSKRIDTNGAFDILINS